MSAPVYKGRSVPILPFAPTRDQRPELRINYETIVREALSTDEERYRMRPRPLYGIRYETVLEDARMSGAFRRTIELIDAIPVGVPWWVDRLNLTGPAGAGVLAIAHESHSETLWPVVADYVLLWRDPHRWEVLEVADISDPELTLLSGPTMLAWEEGDSIVPLVFGKISRGDAEALNDAVGTARIDFEETFHGLFAQDRAEESCHPAASFEVTAWEQEVPVTVSGFEEFVPSSPPRYYRTNTVGGVYTYCTWTVDPGYDAVESRHTLRYRNTWPYGGTDSREISDTDEFPDFGTVTECDHGTTEDWQPLPPGTFGTAGGYPAPEVTRIRKSIADATCAVGDPCGPGEVWEELSDEDTPADALARTDRSAIAWTAAASYETTFVHVLAGDWLAYPKKWRMEIADLEVGRTYTVRWLEDAAQMSTSFTATAATHVIERDVPVGVTPSGWSVT